MATGTDPLQRETIRLTSVDTGDRLQAPQSNAALRLAAALGQIAPEVATAGAAVAQDIKDKTEANATRDALANSGAQMADAVRLGKIRPTQNPWYVAAYNRESAAIRGGDALSALSTDSQTWQEKSDPQAFAQRWHTEVAKLTTQFGTDPDSFKGFQAAEGQATQQALATNQAFNSQRIQSERNQNLSALAADALMKEVQANAGHITGSQAALALAPAKQQWIATGGTLEQWNDIQFQAIQAAGDALHSPSIARDLPKAPELLQGPSQNDRLQYGDGVEQEATPPPTPVDPLAPLPPGQTTTASYPIRAPVVSSPARLAPPVPGRVTNTFAQHQARGSAGVDLAVPIGTKVMTPIGGTAQVGSDPRSGLFVRIVSPDGKIVSSYAHLNVAQVQNGQQVSPGQAVALSGQSGHATGPHVHWRLRVDGKDVDPLAYEVPSQEVAQAAPQPQLSAGEQAPQLAPAAAPQQQAPPPITVTGPSLYGMGNNAEAAETNAYRIAQSTKAQASDRLQAILSQRKLSGIEATDRLYSTFGTNLLSGNVDQPTIVKTLTAAGYAPQVIAEAINNVRAAVGDSEGLTTARLGIQAADPKQGKQIFDLATEGRVNGYTTDYEHKVANAILSGQINSDDGTRMVSSAVSRTEQLQAAGRAQQSFAEAHPPSNPGQIIRKASQVRAGIDQYATVASSRVGRILGRSMTKGEAAFNQQQIKQLVINHLIDNPGDYAGAEKLARDYVASFLTRVASSHGLIKGQTSTTSSPAPAGGNPRR